MLIKSTEKSEIELLENYHKLEEISEFKHEYHDGEIICMTGGTINHNRIIRNLMYCLIGNLKNKPYEVFSSDLRLWIPQYKRGVYPDVMVISEPPIFNKNRQDEILNPCLIFEILSPSTSSYDRGDKFLYYRSIPHFKEYVLVSQSEYLIEHYTKTKENQWLLRSYLQKETTIQLDSVGIDLKISDIYETIELDNISSQL